MKLSDFKAPESSSAEMPRKNISELQLHLILSLLLILGTFAVYAQVASHEFLSFDDPFYVTGNPTVRAGLS